jgi:hypothetical protein
MTYLSGIFRRDVLKSYVGKGKGCLERRFKKLLERDSERK